MAIKMYCIISKIIFMMFLLATQVEESYSEKSQPCGFSNIESSKENPYKIPMISDNLSPSTKFDPVWSNGLFGNVDRTTATFQTHAKYLSASRIANANQYVFYANELSKKFTIDLGTRQMERTVNVYCVDHLDTPYIYYFLIQFQDMTPPTFNEQFYNYTISKDLNRDLPITGERPIIVSDNAFECKEDPEFIATTSSFKDMLKIKKTALGLSANGNYSFRLDLYIRKEAKIEPSTKRVQVFARDDHSSSVVNVQINIE